MTTAFIVKTMSEIPPKKKKKKVVKRNSKLQGEKKVQNSER
jgi:hypothetical protein